jgi:coenzyme F420-reducing hydrogenase gamma subunit
MKAKNKPKPKVAFFGMTSCKGCYFQFLLLGERLLDVLNNIEVSDFWMINEERKDEKYDIAFMDGAVSNKENIEHVKKVREKAKYLIAFGTCACLSGIPGLRNFRKGYHKDVYGKPVKPVPLKTVDPLDKHVKVDYYMFGCPINELEALEVVRDLLLGKTPREPDYPVCVDCKKAGTRCLFKDGVVCMGPVTVAGCGAPCPASRSACDGCRGPLPDANWGSEVDMMYEHGIKKDKIKHMFCKYTGTFKNFGGLKK